MTLIFLGGTCGKNLWREPFIERCVALGVPREALFNPVVEDWNAEAQRREEEVKASAAAHLYYLASPRQDTPSLSTYSFVEATMALYDRPDSCIVVFDPEGIEGSLLKSMRQAEAVLRARFPRASIYSSLDEAARQLAWRFRVMARFRQAHGCAP